MPLWINLFNRYQNQNTYKPSILFLINMDELYSYALPSVVTLMLMAMLQQIHLQKVAKQRKNLLQEATPIPKY